MRIYRCSDHILLNHWKFLCNFHTPRNLVKLQKWAQTIHKASLSKSQPVCDIIDSIMLMKWGVINFLWFIQSARSISKSNSRYFLLWAKLAIKQASSSHILLLFNSLTQRFTSRLESIRSAMTISRQTVFSSEECTSTGLVNKWPRVLVQVCTHSVWDTVSLSLAGQVTSLFPSHQSLNKSWKGMRRGKEWCDGLRTSCWYADHVVGHVCHSDVQNPGSTLLSML
jgi:hypothetical protein